MLETSYNTNSAVQRIVRWVAWNSPLLTGFGVDRVSYNIRTYIRILICNYEWTNPSLLLYQLPCCIEDGRLYRLLWKKFQDPEQCDSIMRPVQRERLEVDMMLNVMMKIQYHSSSRKCKDNQCRPSSSWWYRSGRLCRR